MTWDCGACGCLAIAAGLAACPVCGKEHDMPKTTVAGGGSNAAAEAAEAAEVPAAETAPPAVNASKADWVGHAVAQGVPAAEAEAKTKAELIEDHGG